MPLDKRVAVSLTANPAQNARANNVAQVQVYHCDDPIPCGGTREFQPMGDHTIAGTVGT